MIPFSYNDGGRSDAGYKGHTGDCVCRAIAIVTGRPYEEIYQRLAQGNAQQRRGKYQSKKTAGKRTAAQGIMVKRKWFKDYMHELGFTWVATMQIGQGCKLHLHQDELPGGRIIVALSRHCAAVIDGVLQDVYDCSREGSRCVYGYWKYQN